MKAIINLSVLYLMTSLWFSFCVYYILLSLFATYGSDYE
jgi:hypothetical protein